MNRDDLVVDEPSGARWDAAIEFLRQGRHVSCMGLALTLATESPLAQQRFGEFGVVRVDLSKVSSDIVDVSGGIPGDA